MTPIRVLVVDDSPTIRQLLTIALETDPEIEVVGSAPEPAVARQMIKDLNPDVITLDIEMPHMNGLEFLEKIMRLRPMPVVMVSTLTQRGADATVAALELGAIDYFAKPTHNLTESLSASAAEIAEKVKTAARARVRPRETPAAARAPDVDYRPANKLVAIGSSTGGVEALIEVLSRFPRNCAPTVITQHMPEHFLTSFAQRLDRLCAPEVHQAYEGAALEPGHIYLAPGGEAHLEVRSGRPLQCHLRVADKVSGHRPSVDVLFASAAAAAGKSGVGVILTGMGRDGASGLKAMRDAGAMTVGQDEASSVVYGMPRVAFEIGAVAEQLPLGRIGDEIVRLCRAPIPVSASRSA
ncbi:MAG: chemotaxis response regulator protein-glutamate methylesterase [Alphaproteobacteria bacterium]|nr:chemotaxis response regulator protein-glutamate methylesterase [Alphaproteobacteria bacterium]MDE2011462.1 chemotaxis response regulator protein-glutamate methylesterase [Alphaproteobacteria bacterium]MDE2071853.1 chemotaxis response regulator protein-glutamate methylesterase [Alphaproteobacteria bacterium]MDE2350474.1 chemotaxis response regulator protein-glutamate methylesterase [Alphaproteobacteria bacterium]